MSPAEVTELLRLLSIIASALDRIAKAQEREPKTCSCSRCGDRWDVGTDHVCNAGKT